MIAQRFIELIAGEINVKPEQVAGAIALFDKGATIPFVARYRKDVTGGLSENKLERIEERNDYFIALCAKKDSLLENIEKQQRLTDDLRNAFEACDDHIALEDLSLPFKKQRNNRAAIAANKGLLALADYIWAQSAVSPPPELYAESFVVPDKQVLSVQEALEGARHILSECIAMNADIRREVRGALHKECSLVAHHTRVEVEKSSRYTAYNNFKKPLSEVDDETFLAILKGEREGALRVELLIDDERLIDALASRFIQDAESAYAVEIRAAVVDAYKRLLRPVIEEEVFSTLRRKSEETVIGTCRDHLRNLLLSAPAGPIPVLGICCWSSHVRTLAAVAGDGSVIEATSIAADSEEELNAKTGALMTSMLEAGAPQGIGVSSGPGGRETLRFVQSFLRDGNKRAFATLVQDAGLAAYAHSSLASEELPGMEDSVRAAVSVARRLQDPLHELVKVEPCSLVSQRLAMGVNRRRLQAGAVRTIESVINRVGVDVNHASAEVLRYVSGLQMGVAQTLVEKRTQSGCFKNRTNLLDVSGIGEKTYQQCVGFLKVLDGENPLDGSAIHPEAYPAVEKILAVLNCSLDQIRENSEPLKSLNLADLADETIGPMTLEDICYELGRIGRDPRRRFRPPQNLVSVATIEDLAEGMVLEGLVTNTTDFGIFVSLGLPQEGLVHRSEVGRTILNDPKRSLQVGDVIRVLVLQVDKEHQKIALSIKGAAKLPLTRPSARRPEFRSEGGVDSQRRFGQDSQDGRRRGSRPGPDKNFGDRGGHPSGDHHRPPRKRGKGDLAVPKIGRGESRKEEGSLLNTTLADQLAALRDKIVSKK